MATASRPEITPPGTPWCRPVRRQLTLRSWTSRRTTGGPAPSCTTCASSCASSRRPASVCGAYSPAPNTTSEPTANARAPSESGGRRRPVAPRGTRTPERSPSRGSKNERRGRVERPATRAERVGQRRARSSRRHGAASSGTPRTLPSGPGEPPHGAAGTNRAAAHRRGTNALVGRTLERARREPVGGRLGWIVRRARPRHAPAVRPRGDTRARRTAVRPYGPASGVVGERKIAEYVSPTPLRKSLSRTGRSFGARVALAGDRRQLGQRSPPDLLVGRRRRRGLGQAGRDGHAGGRGHDLRRPAAARHRRPCPPCAPRARRAPCRATRPWCAPRRRCPARAPGASPARAGPAQAAWPAGARAEPAAPSAPRDPGCASGPDHGSAAVARPRLERVLLLSGTIKRLISIVNSVLPPSTLLPVGN